MSRLCQHSVVVPRTYFGRGKAEWFLQETLWQARCVRSLQRKHNTSIWQRTEVFLDYLHYRGDSLHDLPALLPRPGEVAVQVCWHASGDMCVTCNVQRGDNHLNKFRSCKGCIGQRFCRKCKLPPPVNLPTPTCHACDNLAFWCEEYSSETEMQSGLCATHFQQLLAAFSIALKL